MEKFKQAVRRASILGGIAGFVWLMIPSGERLITVDSDPLSKYSMIKPTHVKPRKDSKISMWIYGRHFTDYNGDGLVDEIDGYTVQKGQEWDKYQETFNKFYQAGRKIVKNRGFDIGQHLWDSATEHVVPGIPINYYLEGDKAKERYVFLTNGF